MRIAAILTCFNRKEKTEKCLDSLFRIIPDCDAYITDDNSTDGTVEMIHKKYPHAIVIKGTGQLFWSRGMYTAWKEAIKGNYDFYLWLNDDIELFPFFFDELMHCYYQKKGNCIITGLISEFAGEKIIYGGCNRKKIMIQANNQPQEVIYMNGNVVLIPQSITDTIGIIDYKLHHDLGDVDYGLTAIEHGFKVYTTRKAIAKGYKNDICRVREWGVSLFERFRRLNTPLGSPLKINFYYRKKHFGIVRAIAFCMFLVYLNVLPDLAVEILYGDIYKKGIAKLG